MRHHIYKQLGIKKKRIEFRKSLRPIERSCFKIASYPCVNNEKFVCKRELENTAESAQDINLRPWGSMT